ncbi:MAG TPA: GNAT family N-acetyltransferase [Burkholderiaceae bacterium]
MAAPLPLAFKSLYDTTGWAGGAEHPVSRYEAALSGSWACCSAYADDRLVGFGRVISDGVLHAFITEMIIAPDFQQQGIGRAILDALVQRCLARGVTDIQLFCAEGKEGFYRQGGFAPRLPTRPGMQYMGTDA